MLYPSALFSFTVLFCTFQSLYALECYVCENQEDNFGKCIKTIKTCQYNEDVCLSEISWGSLPYFQEGALKQYYISKGCSSQDKCAKYRSSNMQYCTHIWYQDWKCSECCKGDRCNYYLFSGTNSLKISWSLSLSVLFLSIMYNYLS